MVLELIVLPTKTLGVGDRALLAGVLVDAPVTHLVRRVDTEIARAGKAHFGDFDVVENRTAFAVRLELVGLRDIAEQGTSLSSPGI